MIKYILYYCCFIDYKNKKISKNNNEKLLNNHEYNNHEYNNYFDNWLCYPYNKDNFSDNSSDNSN